MLDKAITFKLRFPSVSRQIEFDLDENDSFEEVALAARDELNMKNLGDKAHEKIDFFFGTDLKLAVRNHEKQFLPVRDVLIQVKGVSWREGDVAEITAVPIYYGA